MSIQPTILLNVFLVVVVVIHYFQPLAARLGFMDVPMGRKRHEAATPTCGGVAILLALAVAATFGALSAPASACAWVLIVACIGAVDDLRGLPALGRLVSYGLAALLLFVSGDVAGVPMGDLTASLPQISPVVGTIVAFGFALLLLNSINMIDGLDGLAGGVTVSALFWLCLIALANGEAGIAGDAEIAIAATAGFLVFNMRNAWRPRASAFLGDAGSTALGAGLAYLILGLASKENAPTFAALLWLVAVPLIDAVSLIIRRIAARRSPFSPDRWHIHHLLLDLGLSHQKASAAITATAFVCGAVGYLGVMVDIPANLMLLGLSLPVAAHTALVRIAARSAGKQASGAATGVSVPALQQR
ncbi:MraY family glycosyltransferase [Qingshengfaniella alkalisoli]|uniref:Undecaprenyl/decaprenyl-phosphate alpha-N-acetylglucosaminyl 1-phosphate transferase n=1 Tax=Qingshengfaniella alkalisoli TaxID=2599296 RepID=A0A5B8IXM8_9RHOB|nr:MraY family glycosyltransferase [Qingshengfaniella alkalisoli]QDY70484.1 undecaprenyl/decaprenyl-phosphate alpha-N-acetylglucosaminyl 1-phosphate transferase [Qingshengfaniella alkalisoli]